MFTLSHAAAQQAPRVSSRPVPAAAPVPAAPVPASPRALGDLLTRARAALEADPRRARLCLDELASLLEPAPEAVDTESLLLPECGTPAPAAPLRGGLAQWQVNRVTRFVEAHVSESIPVETLAREVGLSAGHFSRAFKVSTGETPHTFVIRKRVRQVQTLMLTTEEPLGELACACGFTDQAHMTRLFRKFVGDTPFVWRRAHRAC
ncbi:helix-turn-helix domain-containing protein [Oceanicella sp. SM1341]|uniref:helix-turn-helix domain-containing protein n=1 Tax=Oceanicella sp. SM1341 TaxID=1548889 RepID=UPI000E4BD561|nr:AraC family transcriptional regulator [Oceanicella sp. SM1341]